MRIVVLPIRYPSPQMPTLGVFFQEQLEALTNFLPNWSFALSFVEVFQLHLREPQTWPHFIRNLTEVPPHTLYQKESNLLICHHQVPRWTYRIFHGNLMQRFYSHRRQLQRILRIWGHIDLIHAHVTWPSGWFALKLSEEFGIPYIITEHTVRAPFGPFPYPNPHLFTDSGEPSELITEPIRKAKAMIAVSPALQSHIHSLGLPCQYYIPNLVNEERFKPLLSEQQSNHKKRYVFATLGRMDPQKGIPDLLQAIQIVHHHFPYFFFRIGGTGEALAAYQSQARELGITDCIEWVGAVPPERVPLFLNEADAFVLPSLYETFGVVFAEALACGKPLIATRCGGPEVIVNEHNGLLVDVSNAPALANAMVQLYQNHHKYQPEELRNDFMQRFSRQVVVNQLREVYEKALDR